MVFFLLVQMYYTQVSAALCLLFEVHLTVRKSAFELYKLQRNISSSHIPYLTCKQKKNMKCTSGKVPLGKIFLITKITTWQILASDL